MVVRVQPRLVLPVLLFAAGTLVGAAAMHGAFGGGLLIKLKFLILCGAAVAAGAALLARGEPAGWPRNLARVGHLTGAAVLALCGVFLSVGRTEGIFLLVLGGLVAYGGAEAVRLVSFFLRRSRRA